MPCADDVLLTCTLEICMVLWTSVTPMNSVKTKKKWDTLTHNPEMFSNLLFSFENHEVRKSLRRLLRKRQIPVPKTCSRALRVPHPSPWRSSSAALLVPLQTARPPSLWRGQAAGVRGPPQWSLLVSLQTGLFLIGNPTQWLHGCASCSSCLGLSGWGRSRSECMPPHPTATARVG